MVPDAGGQMPALVDVLALGAREFDGVSWVFTGFNLPVLAARVARRRAGSDFVQLLEAGAALDRDTEELVTSTTDFHAYADVTCYRGNTPDVLLTLIPRCDLVVLDGATIDLRGRTNAHAIGPTRHPRVRLPGAGGAPDAAARARDLLFLNASDDLRRICAQVEHVSTSPAAARRVRLVTRWGILRLGAHPAFEAILDGPGVDTAVDHLADLGVDAGAAADAAPLGDEERADAIAVLHEAAGKGYQAAAQAVAKLPTPVGHR
ncbi:co-chaperone HscB [Mycolicibacterium thermoresistibile]|nr:co-chaperone HscB [Mycolicibacterium thermoresistibile]MCV7191119.1 co-chaperone HscB [Mycolicibacterium thermoresistibile]